MRVIKKFYRRVATLFIVLFLTLSLLNGNNFLVRASENDYSEENSTIEGFSEIQTPAFITANGRTVAVLHRVWSSKLKNWGTWELAELCPYSRWRLGYGNEGLPYGVSEGYFGIRYSKDGSSFFEWSNDFPNIEYADYVAGTQIVQINMSTPTQPDIRMTWVLFASEVADGIVWGVSVTNLANTSLDDVSLYLNFEAFINNERCDFTWFKNEISYVISLHHKVIHVGVSSWNQPEIYYAGDKTELKIYYDFIKNVTDPIKTTSCVFRWSLGSLSPKESSETVFLFIAVGNDIQDVIGKIREAQQFTPVEHYSITLSFWREWLQKSSLETPDPFLNRMYNTSLLLSLMGVHRSTGAIMACMDGTRWMEWGGEESGERWMFRPYYLHVWVRDLVFFSFVFDILGYTDEAREALYFAKSIQNSDGSFYTHYEVDKSVSNTFPEETDQTGLYVYGVYLHYSATSDIGFLEETWESVKKACYYLISKQNEQGLVYTQGSLHEWPGVSQGYEPWTQACSYSALKSGAHLAKILGYLSLASEWNEAADKIREGTITYLWNPTINSFCQRLYQDQQYTWADIKMLTPSLLYFPILNSSATKMKLTYNFLLENLNDTEIGGIWRYQRDAGQPKVPERWNGGYGPWPTYTCWFALYNLANGEVDLAYDWILWCKEHATAQGLLAEHLSTYLWEYLYQNPDNATRSYYGVGTFGSWIAYTLSSSFIKNIDHSGITLYPLIPSIYDSMNLTFKYRDSLFKIEVEGRGLIEKVMVDGQPIQSLRIPDKYFDQGAHTISIKLTESCPSTPYLAESPYLNVQDADYRSDRDILNLKINAPYLTDSIIEIVSYKEPVIIYVNEVPYYSSHSMSSLISHDVGWFYNATESSLYIKVKASGNSINISSLFSYSLKVNTFDIYDILLPGSTVTLFWQNGTKIQTTTSNEEGYALFQVSSKGEYRVNVEHKGIVGGFNIVVETPFTNFNANLDIIGFFLGIPITVVMVKIVIMLMAALAIIYLFKILSSSGNRSFRKIEKEKVSLHV